MNKVRVRIAPSPTGYVHIGNFRTILYNYLFAKKNKADFVVRIEDTDQKRFVPGAIESLLKVLDWAGIEYTEGPTEKLKIKSQKLKVIDSKNYSDIVEIGEYGPYIQSERLSIYKKYAEQLVKNGQAYYCFCTSERLEELRSQQATEKKAPMYDRHCLEKLSKEEVNKKLEENYPYVIRLKVPKNETIEFEDTVRGEIKFDTNTIDDQVLLKSDGYPTYHLAVVVDDQEMGINYVIRGEEWLPSTPKHIILYKAFGWEMPRYAHLPLLLNPDKTKLSKRQGDVAVEDYIKNGYLKEAIINFVALLGWNPGEGSTQEIFTIEELTDKFELERVHKAGAVFDIKKLDWINSEWIKKIAFDDLFNRAKEFYLEKDFYKSWNTKHEARNNKEKEEYLKKVLTVERERLTNLSSVGESNKFFFTDINYAKELLCWKDMTDEELKNNLEKAKNILSNIAETDWTKENLEKLLIDAAGEKRGEFLWPIRAALTGEQKSPSPFEVAWVLGKEETIKRIDKAINLA